MSRLTFDRPLLDDLLQGLPFEQLHHDEMLVLVLVDRVDGTDIGVIQGRGGSGLALESLERGLVLGEVGGQELQRDLAAEARILGLIHHSHAAAAELTGHRVVGNGLADE